MRAEAISWDDWSVSNPPPIADDDKWHVEFEPNEVKIVSLEQLDDLFRLSIVDSETKVWQAGMSEWQPLRVIAGLEEQPAPQPKRAPPKPPTRSAPPSIRPPAPAPRADMQSVRPATPSVRPATPSVRPATPSVRAATPSVRPAAPSVHAGHDDHHDETSSDDFPADEPRSPGWLPLLGGGLFLAAIFAFVLIGADDNAAEAAKPAPVRAAAAPVAPPAQRPIQALRPGTLPPGHAPVAPRPLP